MKRLFALVLAFSFVTIILMSCDKRQARKNEGKYVLTHMKVDLKKPLGENLISKLNEKIYNAAIDNTIKAYRNDSLTTIMTKEELLTKGSSEELIEIIPYPEDPDYVVDSIIYNKFEPSMIAGNQISQKWFFDKTNTFSGELNAFSVTFSMEVEGIKLSQAAIFWIDFDDLNKIASQQELDMIKEEAFKAIVGHLSDY